MNSMVIKETGSVAERNHCEIRMPLGLLGFEQCKRFTLSTRPAEEPFLRLQAVEIPNWGSW